ncbi:MAG TPA: glycosyltransferase [Chloroflexia bacterium]|nr:glycosyltransferase [Chloroflexia bacterium]
MPKSHETMKRPTLLYFQQNPVFGSTEGYLFDLASNVDKMRFDTHLLCSDASALDRFLPLQEMDVTLHRVSNRVFTGNALRAIVTLTAWLRRVRPDIVHFNDPCLTGIISAKLARIPVAVMMHHTPELERRYNLFGRTLERLAFRTRPRVIFQNESNRQLSIKKDGVPLRDTVVIPYGLRGAWFASPDPGLRRRVRASLGVGDNQVVILTPARLDPQKRHDILIEAARMVLSEHQQVLFLLAGEGELRAQIEIAARQAGIEERFRLLGFRTDIADLMRASDILAMSSDFEGLPYAILEGSAVGLPVVSTDVSGVSYAVKDGETGLLVPAGDVAALAQALASLVRDPARRRRFGDAGAERARLLFTVERMMRDTEAAYLHWLRQRKRPQ